MAFAFIFDTVSGGEWLVLLAVILIVVGPKNLPAAARKTGEILAKLRRAADEFKRQLMTMDQEVSRTVNEVAGELRQDYLDMPSDDVAGTDQDASGHPDEPGVTDDDYYGDGYMGDAGPAYDGQTPGDEPAAQPAGEPTPVGDAVAATTTDTGTDEIPPSAT